LNLLHGTLQPDSLSDKAHCTAIMQSTLPILLTILSVCSRSISAGGGWSSFSLFQPPIRITSSKKTRSSSSTIMILGPSEKQASPSSLLSSQSALESKVIRNLKTVPVKEDGALLARWNELKGLSEKELIVSSSSSILKAERSEIALGLAYRRCEYVTQLFSKTFYMGTSLMRPDARAHVWAIYAWCRRTDDIVDSPRALLNREVLTKDLEDWSLRLDKIWAGKSMIHDPY
jgi:Squalene/phytoene synthase